MCIRDRFETLPGYELDKMPRYYVWGEEGKTEEQTATEMAAVLAEAEVDWDQVTFIPFGESMMETINNEPLTTSITATKQWLDMNGEQSPAAELPESITLTLYQHIDGTKTAVSYTHLDVYKRQHNHYRRNFLACPRVVTPGFSQAMAGDFTFQAHS